MSGLSLALAVPAVCAALLWWTRTRAIALACAPWTAAPAFLLAIAGAPEVVSWPSVLFGLDLGVDPVDRGFLLLTSAVWLAAGVFGGTYMAAAPRRARLWTCFLVTQAANLGVVLAFDVASFYCFYSVMTIAAFGLVVHEETPLARRAARIYLVLALLGELAVLAAMFLIVGPRIDLPLSAVPEAIASSPSRDAITSSSCSGSASRRARSVCTCGCRSRTRPRRRQRAPSSAARSSRRASSAGCASSRSARRSSR